MAHALTTITTRPDIRDVDLLHRFLLSRGKQVYTKNDVMKASIEILCDLIERETTLQRLSMKQAVDNLQQHGILRPNSGNDKQSIVSALSLSALDEESSLVDSTTYAEALRLMREAESLNNNPNSK